MSELNTTKTASADLRWQLLTTASALALLTNIVAGGDATASEADRPTVWIELGGALQRIGGTEERFAPDFTTNNADLSFNEVSPLSLQRLPRYAVDGDTSISISPRGTDWSFVAAVRYGRSNGEKSLHQQAHYVKRLTNGRLPSDSKYLFIDAPYTNSNHTEVDARETHLVLDFRAGKDVGLGLSGGIESKLSLGVRYAQFTTNMNTQFYSMPVQYLAPNFNEGSKNWKHSYFADSHVDRSFHGIGPSLSWEGKIKVAGNREANELSADWGINAAILFGRQKADGYFQSADHYLKGQPGFGGTVTVTPNNRSLNRSNKRIVPNFGGFAGVSFKSDNAKVSFGYRADFFLGAMDGGLASRDNRDRSFHGPFAKASIGLGG